MKISVWGAIIMGGMLVLTAMAGAATFYVNIGTDLADADLNDGICDSDFGTGGEQCTLRAAIEQANFLPGPDEIFFNLPTGITPVLPVLSVLSPLPAVTDTVVIDASTQPLFTRVELSGLFAGAGAKGLIIQANNCTVRNLTINRFLSSGILLRQGGGHTIQGCYVGLNSGGATARPNGLDGLLIESSSNNLIGGFEPGLGNVISGNNRNGIQIMPASAQADVPQNNVIVGNRIGTSAAGTAKLANAVNGIVIENAKDTIIGAGDASGRNVISGNNASGILITGDAEKAAGTMIWGNFIGTGITGVAPLGNAASGIIVVGAGPLSIGDPADAPGLPPGNVIAANAAGITLEDVAGQVRIQGNSIGAGPEGAPVMPNTQDGVRAAGASRLVVVGGPVEFTGNLISHNGQHGVAVGPAANQIAVLRNSMRSNTGLGIDLGDDGPTLNDPGDTDSGANGLLNFPQLLIAGTRAGRLRVDGALASVPDTDFRVEFFSNEECDPAGFGEGETFLGFTEVRTTDAGETVFSVYLPQPPPDYLITATATTADGSTSEFSACEPIVEIDIEGVTLH